MRWTCAPLKLQPVQVSCAHELGHQLEVAALATGALPQYQCLTQSHPGQVNHALCSWALGMNPCQHAALPCGSGGNYVHMPIAATEWAALVGPVELRSCQLAVDLPQFKCGWTCRGAIYHLGEILTWGVMAEGRATDALSMSKSLSSPSATDESAVTVA